MGGFFNRPQPFSIAAVCNKDGSKCYVISGSAEDRKSSPPTYKVYDCYLERFLDDSQGLKPSGCSPKGLEGTSYCVSPPNSGGDIFAYGGRVVCEFYGGFYKFSQERKEWTSLSDGSHNQQPMKKCGCGIAIFGSKILVIGGYGVLTGPKQKKSNFIRDERPEYKRDVQIGWTNEAHLFDLGRCKSHA